MKFFLLSLWFFLLSLTSANAQTIYPWESRIGAACSSYSNGTDHALCMDSVKKWMYKCATAGGGLCNSPVNGYQWLGTATEVTTPVNVGIGTANPQVQLDVEGTSPSIALFATTDSTGAAVEGIDGAGDVGALGAGALGAGVIGIGIPYGIYGQDARGDYGIMADFSFGAGVYAQGSAYGVYATGPANFFSDNVGIGTIAPAGSLDVGPSGTICLGGDCESTWPAGTGWALSGTDLYNTNAGNVGIGSSVPGAKLDIQGTTRIRFSSGDSLTVADIFSPLLSSGIPTLLPLANVGIGTIYPIGAVVGDLFFQEDPVTSFGPGVLMADSTATYLAQETLDTGTGALNLETNGPAINFYAGNNSNAGISVVDQNTGQSLLVGSIPFAPTPDGVSTLQVAGLTRTDELVVGANVGLAFAGSGDSLIVSTGNVGIGSTYPGALLDVQGTVRALYFKGDGSQLTGVGGVSGLTTNYVPKASSSTTIANGTMYDNGNVGIGTAAPQAKFHLANGNFLSGATPTSFGAIKQVYSGADDGTNFLGIYNSATLLSYGISATLPAPTGTSTIGGYFKGLGIGGSTSSGNHAIFGILNSAQSGSGIGAVAWTITDTNVVQSFNNTLDNGSGNVGIGSANPGQALDVLGTVRITRLGSTMAVASGTNGCQGQATLSTGTVTVTTNCTPTTSQGIFLTDAQTSIVNVGSVTIATVTSGSSFVIQSTNVADGSKVNWWIIKSS